MQWLADLWYFISVDVNVHVDVDDVFVDIHVDVHVLYVDAHHDGSAGRVNSENFRFPSYGTLSVLSCKFMAILMLMMSLLLSMLMLIMITMMDEFILKFQVHITMKSWDMIFYQCWCPCWCSCWCWWCPCWCPGWCLCCPDWSSRWWLWTWKFHIPITVESWELITSNGGVGCRLILRGSLKLSWE